MWWDRLRNDVEAAIAENPNDSSSDHLTKAQPADVLENVVVELRELRQEVRQTSRGIVGVWQVNELAILDEVHSILELAGISASDVRVTDIHSNGVIYVDIDLNESLSRFFDL
jgi:hypothetical protein